MIPVRIYDNPDTANNNPIADLKNAENISYEKKINRAGNASFTIPADDPHVSYFDILDYAEIYDGDERVGLYRIRKKRPTKANGRQKVQYECRHVLDTLNQGRIVNKVTKTGVSTALSYILGEQQTAHWQLGAVDFSKSFDYEFQQQSLLNALLSVPQVWWNDYEFTYDTTSYPWTLNLVTPNTTPQATLYYNKNIKTIEKEVSTDELATELYALGDGSGDDRVKVGPLTSNTGTYGYHTKIWEESHYDNATDLQAAAQKYLNKHDTPRVSYSGDAHDLYRIIEDSNNQLNLGDYVQVYDPELGFDTNVRVVRLQKRDMTGEPISLSFELDNKRRLVPNFGALAREDKVTEDNINSGSIGGGGIAGGADSIADQSIAFSKFSTEFTDEDGERIEGRRMRISAQTIFDAAYDPGEQWPDNASAPDTAKVQGETLIEGGYIKTVYLDAEFAKIDTLDLTDTTLTVNSVKEGGADETVGHITASTYSLADTESASNFVQTASLFTDTSSFLDSASVTKYWDNLVYGLNVSYTTIDGTQVVSDVSALTVSTLGDVSLSTSSSGAVVTGLGTYVSTGRAAALTDISYVNKDVLISVSS